MASKSKDVPVGSMKSDKDWQAEEDARTMQRMGEIMNDPKRHANAKKQMEKMMADMKKSEMAMMKMMGKDKGKEDESMGGMIKKHQKERTVGKKEGGHEH